MSYLLEVLLQKLNQYFQLLNTRGDRHSKSKTVLKVVLSQFLYQNPEPMVVKTEITFSDRVG